MSFPVNLQTSNNYGTQQYNTQTGAVPTYSQSNYPAVMTQSPQMGVQVGPPMTSAFNSQPVWTVVPQAYLLNFYEAFLKGKPKALGSLVIIVAILEIALGIISIFIGSGIITFYSFTSFWCPMFYIIAGSLTVAAQPKPNICLIQGSLAMNIISFIFSLAATIINALDLAFGASYFNGRWFYYGGELSLDPIYSLVVTALLLAANGLLLFVTFSISIFGCMSMSKLNSTFPQQLMIRNDGAFAVNLGAVSMTGATYGYPAEPQQPQPANNVRLPIT
ncbi:membrane-spanning 4-domains subfamily A member 4A-like isoform X1 [Rana temporaria]|uniref:membrane-spanning 4-domains subfamily A member 4A-like isoform X1 n=1 Tax=Rana temporaria TaxID=8407 RepID=UPI001AACAF84|nr:membrane-spanning 4-domains subfamily A member 4A-like isoform X1 [Rana temporaria]